MKIAISADMNSDDRLTLSTCSITMRFSTGESVRAVQLLRSVVGQIQSKRGCHSCTLGRDATEEGWVYYSEQWDSEKAFRLHVLSDEFTRVLVAMDLCVEEPQVMIGNLTTNCGIESLRVLRAKAESDPVSDSEPMPLAPKDSPAAGVEPGSEQLEQTGRPTKPRTRKSESP